MIEGAQDPFLNYYHRELTYLRKAGALFAERHPKIARRLELGQGESPDPHVERLLESFAFLTARIQQEIDDRLPQLSAALLSVLYPQLMAPIPSMAICQFQADSSKGKLNAGFVIPRETSLFTYAEEGISCRFRTAYPVTLWPISITRADFVPVGAYEFGTLQPASPWYLRLKLATQGGVAFSDLKLEQLRLHIYGDRILCFSLYECLFAQSNPQVLYLEPGSSLHSLPPRSLNPVGFVGSEAILPIPPNVHPAYQILQEYFHFPDKFLFFSLSQLDFSQVLGEELEILISLGETHMVNKLSISANNFLLGCTPIVNLFVKTTDPLRLDHRKLEYRLVPDQRRERTTEIHTILKVMAAIDGSTETKTFTPYFSYNHQSVKQRDTLFWLSRRQRSFQKEIPGTDVLLSFVDLNFNAKVPPQQTVFATTLCTNRFLSEQLSAGSLFQIEDKTPTSNIVCLTKPLSQAYSPTDGETLWQLISQLSINHLSLSTGPSAIVALKEMLQIYAGIRSQSYLEIDALKNIETLPIVRRMGDQAWRGFVRGLGVTVTMDERFYTGSSSFLLAMVLQHFFSLQISVNSFIELTLKGTQRQGVWMRWHPQIGEQILL